jgi:hypothetical protein
MGGGGCCEPCIDADGTLYAAVGAGSPERSLVNP